MKYTWFLSLAAVVILACQPQQQSGTEEKAETETESEIATGKFGAEISEDGAVSLTQLVDVLEAQEAFEGKIIGEIKDVCSKKGCWLTVDLPNGQSMRVTFKDYGFFVPKNSQGYPVILEGIASKKTTDVETLRHYAEDAGKSKAEIEAIVADKEEYTFEAVGVIINTAEI
jgi:hypothetical protein